MEAAGRDKGLIFHQVIGSSTDTSIRYPGLAIEKGIGCARRPSRATWPTRAFPPPVAGTIAGVGGEEKGGRGRSGVHANTCGKVEEPRI